MTTTTENWRDVQDALTPQQIDRLTLREELLADRPADLIARLLYKDAVSHIEGNRRDQ
jgi:hypothetical protein